MTVKFDQPDYLVGEPVTCKADDHPPTMKPGEKVSFPYLLTGYRLEAGTYTLHAKCKAGVRPTGNGGPGIRRV